MPPRPSHVRSESSRALAYPSRVRPPTLAEPTAASPGLLFTLAALGVRALVLGFAAVAIWKLGLVAVDHYEATRFTRPPVTTLRPEARPSPATDAGLENIMRRAGLPGGTVASYVRNIPTGASAGVNSDRQFRAASLYKLPVLVEVFKQQRLKRFSWDDYLTIGREHWTDGSGVLQARVGDRVQIGELLRLMIVESDNIAANMLTELVGVASINATMETLGLRSTRMIDPLRENASPVTTAADMGRLLEVIGTGQLVDAQTSEEAIRLLESKQAQAWLADGLPLWGRLAHKWGDVPNARHDAGIIYTPHNQIVMVVLTENGGPAQAADQIRTLSRDIVSYIEGPGP